MLLALTGATGFIGQHLLRELPKHGHRLRVLLRKPSSMPMQCASAVIGDLARPLNMSAALEGVDVVIHWSTTTAGKLSRCAFHRRRAEYCCLGANMDPFPATVPVPALALHSSSRGLAH